MLDKSTQLKLATNTLFMNDDDTIRFNNLQKRVWQIEDDQAELTHQFKTIKSCFWAAFGFQVVLILIVLLS